MNLQVPPLTEVETNQWFPGQRASCWLVCWLLRWLAGELAGGVDGVAIDIDSKHKYGCAFVENLQR